MKPDIENMKLRAQETLDELFVAHLIPFQLTAYKVNADGPGQYIVPFYDSRINSINVSWKGDESFKEAVRAAVLDRMKTMRGPLKGLRSHA